MITPKRARKFNPQRVSGCDCRKLEAGLLIDSFMPRDK